MKKMMKTAMAVMAAVAFVAGTVAVAQDGLNGELDDVLGLSDEPAAPAAAAPAEEKAAEAKEEAAPAAEAKEEAVEEAAPAAEVKEEAVAPAAEAKEEAKDAVEDLLAPVEEKAAEAKEEVAAPVCFPSKCTAGRSLVTGLYSSPRVFKVANDGGIQNIAEAYYP